MAAERRTLEVKRKLRNHRLRADRRERSVKLLENVHGNVTEVPERTGSDEAQPSQQ